MFILRVSRIMVIIIMKHFRKNTVMEVSVIFLGGFWGFGGGLGVGMIFGVGVMEVGVIMK